MLRLPPAYVRDRKSRGLNKHLEGFDDTTFIFSIIPLTSSSSSIIPGNPASLGSLASQATQPIEATQAKQPTQARIALITAPLDRLVLAQTGVTHWIEPRKIGVKLQTLAFDPLGSELQTTTNSGSSSLKYPVEILTTKYINVLIYDLIYDFGQTGTETGTKTGTTFVDIVYKMKSVKNSTKFHASLSLPENNLREAVGEAEYSLTVTTLMKDENQFLEEWLEYYTGLGVEHFYLYDNGTQDQEALERILRPWVDRGKVTLIPWNVPYGPTDGAFSKWYKALSKTQTSPKKIRVSEHRYCQPAQTNDALLRYGPRSQWMLFIDVDEYLNTRGRSLLDLIGSLDRNAKKPSVLSFASIWFGNPRKEPIRVPPGESVRNWYQYRSAKSCGAHRRKCAVNPGRLREAGALYHIHGPVRPYLEKRQPKSGGGGGGGGGGRSNLVYHVPEEKGIFHHYYCCSSKERKTGHDEVLDTSLLTEQYLRQDTKS